MPPPEKPPSLRQKYCEFAKKYKKLNNFITASIKTCMADLVIQVGVEGRTWSNYNWKRCFIFFLYGGVFRSQLQYWFQIKVFSKLFPGINRFTSQTWAQKFRDLPGIRQLFAQVFLDNLLIYFAIIPVFYIFKSIVYDGGANPVFWLKRAKQKMSET